MNIFKSAFEKLSVEAQQDIAIAAEMTAQAVNPGGALFGKVDEMVKLLKASLTKKENKSSSAGSGSAGSAIMMRLIGGKALTQIGDGLKLIVDALNKLEGSPEDIQKKMAAITMGVDTIATMGPAILKFAGYMALAAPLMLIGAITAPLWGLSVLIIAKTLELSSKPLANKNVQAAMEGLQQAAVAILLLGVAMVLAVPLYTYGIQALPMVAATILILGLTFWALDKLGIDKSMKATSEALMFASAAIVTVGLGLLLTSIILDAIPDKWTTLMQILGIVTGIGLVFAIAGIFKSQIAYGALAMIFTAIPIILLSLAMVIFSEAVQPNANGWESIGQILALVTGLGVVMALAGVASELIIPGAFALILAGGALISIGLGVKVLGSAFKGGALDAMLEDSGHVTDSFLGFGGGRMMSKMEYFMYSLANSFLINPLAIASMYATVPIMILAGVSLMSIAKGIEAFQALKIDYAVLPNQIAMVTNVLANAFGSIGEKFPGGRNFLSFVGLGSQSAVADGIDAVLGMGNALSSIAQGTQAMADLRFPIYEGTKIVGYRTLDSGVFSKVAANAGMLTTGLATVFGEIGKQYPGGSSWFSGLGVGQSAVADGIDAVQGMGNAMTEIAKGVQEMANLRFPIYQNGKIVGYQTLDAGVWDKVRTNIQNIVAGLSDVFGKIGKSPDAEDSWGWFGHSNIEEGIQVIDDIAAPLRKIITLASEIAKNPLDGTAISNKVQTIIGGFSSAFGQIGKKNVVTWDMVTMAGTLADKIQAIVDKNNDFNNFVDSYGKYVNHFIRFKDAVNQFDKENLKLTNDLFNGLTYLAKTDDAVEKMGEQLTAAIKKLADMIEESKNNIVSSGEKNTNILSGIADAFGFGDNSSSSSSNTNPAPAPKPVAINSPANVNAATKAAQNNQDISALVSQIQQLVSRLGNDYNPIVVKTV